MCLAADATDPAAVRALLAQMRRSMEEAPWPLSATLLERTAAGWRRFQPPAELAAGARTLGLPDLARTCHVQKISLDKLHARTQTDLFVAGCRLRAPRDRPDAVPSYAAWSAGVDTLLPGADTLMVNRNPLTPPPEVLTLPRATAERICGRYLEATQEDPVRYRVRAFPNEQGMGAAEGGGHLSRAGPG